MTESKSIEQILADLGAALEHLRDEAVDRKTDEALSLSVAVGLGLHAGLTAALAELAPAVEADQQ